MSYILDALRRLEQDKEKARMSADPIRTVLQGHAPSVRPPPAWRGRTIWPWLPAGLLLLFLAVGITFWVARSTAPLRQDAGPAPHSVTPAVASREPSPSTGVSSETGPEPSQVWGGAGEADPSTVARGFPPLASGRPGGAPLPPLPAAFPAAPGTVPSVGVPSGQAFPPKGVLPPEPELVRDDISSPGDRFTEPTLIRLSAAETGLRISAIVWSPVPEKRFAIVNLKTLHEGDSVDDGRVAEIREDEVVFEKGGRRFSVGMGKR